MASVWLRLDPRLRRQGSLIAATSMVNLLSLVMTMITGILLARALGDDGRGAYAAVSAWYGIALIVGELGQSVATTYRAANRPSERRETVASARAVMAFPLIATALVGWLGSTVLADGNPQLVWSYRVAFLSVAVNGLVASFVFAMQAVSIRAWNAIRLSQSGFYLLAVAGMAALSQLTVLTAVLCTAGATSAQMALAYILGRRALISGGRVTRRAMRWLASFGVRQSASAIPAGIASNADKVALWDGSSPADLGHYTVAQTVSNLAGTLGTAISSVSFPQLAEMSSQGPERSKTEMRLIVVSGLVVLVASTFLASISRWAIPLLYGPSFSSSAELVWWLLPAAVLGNSSLVVGTVLRGRALPGRAAAAQMIGLLTTFSAVVVLVPTWGTKGAALALALGSLTSLSAGLFAWSRCVARLRTS